MFYQEIGHMTCNGYKQTLADFVYWFVENKRSIYFGEDETRSILFGRKKYKTLKKINLRRGDIETLSGHISPICFG